MHCGPRRWKREAAALAMETGTPPRRDAGASAAQALFTTARLGPHITPRPCATKRVAGQPAAFRHTPRTPLRHRAACAGLRTRLDDRVCRAAGARVRTRGVGLHGDASPARGRRRLLRPRHAGRVAAQRDARAQGLDRGSAVRGMSTLVGAEILTEEARAFVTRLHRELNPMRLELLARRQERQRELDAGAPPAFLPGTSATRG